MDLALPAFINQCITPEVIILKAMKNIQILELAFFLNLRKEVIIPCPFPFQWQYQFSNEDQDKINVILHNCTCVFGEKIKLPL